jgi:hypothetical protein
MAVDFQYRRTRFEFWLDYGMLFLRVFPFPYASVGEMLSKRPLALTFKIYLLLSLDPSLLTSAPSLGTEKIYFPSKVSRNVV